MLVTKASGDKEEFSEEKVRESIRRAGISQALQDPILSHIKTKLHEGIATSEIYHHITEFLGKSDQPHFRAKYGLKQAIMELGPTGYPFEDFIADILQTNGYTTEVRVVLAGKCISHEVDVIAQKDGKRFMVEAKFHNNPGIRTEVHVSLYTHSRFLDVAEKHQLNKAWIVTNTKATIDAIVYAHCAGLNVVSWSYPDGESLREMIEKARLHPITALTTLSQAQKTTLLENHMVLCKDLYGKKDILEMLHIPPDQKERIIEEARLVCET